MSLRPTAIVCERTGAQGMFVAIDDPDTSGVLLIPCSFEHRRVLTQQQYEAEGRFEIHPARVDQPSTSGSAPQGGDASDQGQIDDPGTRVAEGAPGRAGAPSPASEEGEPYKPQPLVDACREIVDVWESGEQDSSMCMSILRAALTDFPSSASEVTVTLSRADALHFIQGERSGKVAVQKAVNAVLADQPSENTEDDVQIRRWEREEDERERSIAEAELEK